MIKPETFASMHYDEPVHRSCMNDADLKDLSPLECRHWIEKHWSFYRMGRKTEISRIMLLGIVYWNWYRTIRSFSHPENDIGTAFCFRVKLSGFVSLQIFNWLFAEGSSVTCLRFQSWGGLFLFFKLYLLWLMALSITSRVSFSVRRLYPNNEKTRYGLTPQQLYRWKWSSMQIPGSLTNIQHCLWSPRRELLHMLPGGWESWIGVAHYDRARSYGHGLHRS